jgi:protein-L-isoaspartate(D-aspartate) O-methyltransferase
MTEALELEAGHKVLEIGTGSGYQAAVLAEICLHVYSVEIVEPLGIRAALILDTLGYKNIHLRIGDGYAGWPEQSPFDRIIVTCAPEEVPQVLVDQLAPGGKLVIPVGAAHGRQHMVFIEKDQKGRVRKREGHPVRFVPMTGGADQDP